MPSVSKPNPVSPTRYLVPVATATVLIAICPVLIVWWLRASGTVASPLPEIVLGMTLSLAASCLGCAYWERRTGSSDLLFSELMIWGFLRRLHTQRRLASPLDTVGPMARDVEGVTRAMALLELVAAGRHDALKRGPPGLVIDLVLEHHAGRTVDE